ncbi:hypothetical protein E1263_11560 [Kribbella antibiotica]|uniref:Uncharacterized protein n=1 Tax=Kribbella antibiotica TaxID=190195 RepID=A0A4R4ZN45_9ACTN|nr:hypothetical protein [Kribbella antibiotica]TDD60253.1 hypothetical protein E1263_11560 [Kribbella antibiotica]
MGVDGLDSDRVQLDEVLASGPFSLALKLAIRGSGLSLDRLQHKLEERGARVSKTALSYWQHGRTRPERPESLRALSVVEEVLGLDPEALSSLLGPARPRGRWLAQHPNSLRLDEAWARPDGLSRALQRMGTSLDALHRLTKVGVHITSTVSKDHKLLESSYLVVVRAVQDNVDRYVAAFRTDAGMVEPLRIEDTVGCRVGRRRDDEATGFCTYELLLERPLRAGELTVLRYTLRSATAEIDAYQSHRAAPGLLDFSIQVRFDPSCLPVRVYRTHRLSVADSEPKETDLWLGASHTAQLVEVNPLPGIYRVAWAWD